MHCARCLTLLLMLALARWPSLQAAEGYYRQTNWTETMLLSRQTLLAAHLPQKEQAEAASQLWKAIKEDFPVQSDWLLQDGSSLFPAWFLSATSTEIEQQLIARALSEPNAAQQSLSPQLEQLSRSKAPGDDRRWLALYEKACEQRRARRLHTVLEKTPRIIFTKHPTIRPSFFAYTEGQSDAQHERHFLPGSELCLLEMLGLYGTVTTLLSDPKGAIRDPAVSWEADRVVFAWKKSLNEDDYHLYELNLLTRQVRQITSGLGFADYEPAFLPSGDLIFASTRCVQTVDCWWTEVSNLYTCDCQGRYLRRLGFDQVHTVYPQVLDDGRVLYTRWDYNDRGQIFPQPLFQMNPDGTGQTEFYGNNSWFPTTIAHARGVPGTQKVLAILCGHHTSQAGKLALLDPAKGRQENTGVQLVAPIRQTRAEHIDAYGQQGELWQYPYPLNEHEFLVTFSPSGWASSERRQSAEADFALYWMDVDGHRELLVSDPRLPCNQPVPLAPRPRPTPLASRVNYSQTNGSYYVQDIYAGPSLAGVPRGTIKKLRVVALAFRAAGIGQNGSHGPAGGALISTPVSIGNGSWDVKTVLGQAKVYEDGSAFFTVPARTPVYFQALDAQGYAVQTMRSWSTLQPGEFFGCVGCHESKNAAASVQSYRLSQALKAGAQTLEPFYGPARGFSFPREIQPILDRHCIRCHKDRAPIQALLTTGRPPLEQTLARSPSTNHAPVELAFSLLSNQITDPQARRHWSDAYLVLTQARPDKRDGSGEGFRGNNQGKMVNWLGSQSVPEPLPPYFAGAARSHLLPLLQQGHKGVRLSREELEKLACWLDLLVPFCGDYREANAWSEEESRKYDRYAQKRLRMEQLEQQNLRALRERP